MFITRINIYNNGILKLLILGLWDFRGCREWVGRTVGQGGSVEDPQPWAMDAVWE